MTEVVRIYDGNALVSMSVSSDATETALTRFGVDDVTGSGELVAQPGIVEEQRDIAIGSTARRPAEQKVGKLRAGRLLDLAAERRLLLLGVPRQIGAGRADDLGIGLAHMREHDIGRRNDAARSSSRRFKLLTCMPGSSHSAANTGSMLLVAHMTTSAPVTASRAVSTGVTSMSSFACISRANASRRSRCGL